MRSEPEVPAHEVDVPLACRLVAEAVGTSLLIVAVISSGILARLSPNDAGQQLLEHTAVTVARTLSDTFAGMAASSAPTFIVTHLVGVVLAFSLIRFLYPSDASEESDV